MDPHNYPTAITKRILRMEEFCTKWPDHIDLTGSLYSHYHDKTDPGFIAAASEPPTKVTKNMITWKKDDRTHREYDLPASICSTGDMAWFTRGIPVRDLSYDMPSVYSKHELSWHGFRIMTTCKDYISQKHRSGDLPACIDRCSYVYHLNGTKDRMDGQHHTIRPIAHVFYSGEYRVYDTYRVPGVYNLE